MSIKFHTRLERTQNAVPDACVLAGTNAMYEKTKSFKNKGKNT